MVTIMLCDINALQLQRPNSRMLWSAGPLHAQAVPHLVGKGCENYDAGIDMRESFNTKEEAHR